MSARPGRKDLAGPPNGWTFGYISKKTSGVCPHDPPCIPDKSRCKAQPKQAFAHACLATIMFYGGAAGGGKSFWAIVEAVTLCIQYRGIQVAIFRRTAPELRQSIILDFLLLVPRFIAVYNKSDSCARFWNGSIIWFCYAKYEQDVYKYQSAQWEALFIDEASHFTEFQVLYLITRVRSAAGIRKRICLTSNPGNVGHGWLKRWFMRPVPAELGLRPTPQPFEVWRPLPKEGDPTKPEHVPTRCYIPAFFQDNYALQAGDPHYLAQVYALGGDRAKQLAEGDWDANDSMIVGGLWQERFIVKETSLQLRTYGLEVGKIIPWHVIPNKSWVPQKGATIFGSVDYGYGAPWSFHLHAGLPGDHVRTFFEFYMPRVRDSEQARMIANVITNNGWRPEWIVMDPAMWNSRAEVGLSKSIAEVYSDHLGNICALQPGAAGAGARRSRPQRWLDALQTAPDGLPHWTITTACPDAIRTVPDIPWDPKRPNVEDERSENHAYEDIGRFFEARPFTPRQQPVDPFEHLDAISRQHHESKRR